MKSFKNLQVKLPTPTSKYRRQKEKNLLNNSWKSADSKLINTNGKRQHRQMNTMI